MKKAKLAGQIFQKLFKDSSKYNSFLLNFCIYHDSIDLYKIPFTFMNEFIYYSHAAEKNHFYGIDVFYLIDQFYGKRKMINFEEIMEDEKEDTFMNINEDEIDNIYLFSYQNFLQFYNNKLKVNINREKEDDKEIFSKIKEKKKYKNNKRTGYYLSNILLNYYIFFSNNNYEKLKDCFKIKQCASAIDQQIERIEQAVKDNSFMDGFEVIEKKNDNIIISLNNKSLNKNDKQKEDIKNPYLDYYSIKTKDKKEKIKFFGGYELIDITNVIERHFVLERCFSSYGLIKFSLLNILAITRGIEGQKINNKAIINAMCDFCEKTKSLVRKYMNIFINIFQNLKSKIGKNVEEYNYCLYIITSYFIRNNMIPTEETNNLIKMNEDSTTGGVEDAKDVKDVDADIQKIKQKNKIKTFFDKTKKELYENALLTIETIFCGNYDFEKKEEIEEFAFNSKDLYQMYKKIIPHIKDKVKDKDKNSTKFFIPETPLSLYTKSTNLLNNYLKNFVIDKSMYGEIGICILSLLYYFKIPIINSKWVEKYNEESIFKGKTPKKMKEKNYTFVRNKSTIIVEENNELNNIIEKIIIILSHLFDIITKNK